jgi:hypothetical protein
MRAAGIDETAIKRSLLRGRKSNIMSGTVYIFRWDRHDRKGQSCLVLARGKMNSCLVKFEDGYTMVTSRNALRRCREHSDPIPAFPALSKASGFGFR